MNLRLLKRILKPRFTLAIALTLGTFHAFHVYLQVQTNNGDRVYNIAGAQSFLDYGSYLLPNLDPDDLAQSHYDVFFKWRRFYPMLLVGISKLALNINDAVKFLDFLTFFLFYFSWGGIFLLIRKYFPPPYAIGLMGFWCFFYSPLNLNYSTDALALALFSAGLASSLAPFHYKKYQAICGFLAALFFGMTAELRYAYWSVFAGTLVAVFRFWLRYKVRTRRFVSFFFLGAFFWICAIAIEELSNPQTLAFFNKVLKTTTPFPASGLLPGHPNVGLYWKGIFTNAFPFFNEFVGLQINFSRLFSLLKLPTELLELFHWVYCFLATIIAYRGYRLRGMPGEVTSEDALVLELFSSFAKHVSLSLFLFLFSMSAFLYLGPGQNPVGYPRYYGPIFLFLIFYIFRFASTLSSKRSVGVNQKRGFVLLGIFAIPVLGNLIVWNAGRITKNLTCGFYNANLEYFRKYREYDKLEAAIRRHSIGRESVFYLDDNSFRGAYLWPNAFCLIPPDVYTSKAVRLLIVQSKIQPLNCGRLAQFGLGEVVDGDVFHLVQRFKGLRIDSSDYWDLYELALPKDTRFTIPNELGCLHQKRNEWTAFLNDVQKNDGAPQP